MTQSSNVDRADGLTAASGSESGHERRMDPRQLLDSLQRYGSMLRRVGVGIGLVALIVTFSLLSPGFLSVETFRNIAVQSSINAIVGVGQTIVIIGAGIDLSVGSLVALCGVILADLLQSGVPIVVAVPIVLVVGVVFGLLNAGLVVFGRLAPFIATLGTLSAYRGLALLYTGGRPIYGLPDEFRSFFAGSLWGIPSPVLIVAIVAGLAHVFLWHTRAGRHVMAVGGNEYAAKTAGIEVGRIKALTYALSGLSAAIAAAILVARLGAAEPIAGETLELTAIAVAAIGGASLSGGRGSITGAVVGALLIGTLLAGLTILNVQAFWQLVAIGVVIVLAVLSDPERAGVQS